MSCAQALRYLCILCHSRRLYAHFETSPVSILRLLRSQWDFSITSWKKKCSKYSISNGWNYTIWIFMYIFRCLEIITSCACHRLNATAIHHHIILTYLCCYDGKFFFIYYRRRRALARSLCHIIIFYYCNSNGVLNSNRPKHTFEPIQTKIKHICHIGNAAKIVDFSTSVRKYWFCICFHHNQHIFLVKLLAYVID